MPDEKAPEEVPQAELPPVEPFNEPVVEALAEAAPPPPPPPAAPVAVEPAPSAAAGDNRHRNSITDCGGEFQIIACAMSVSIPACQQYLAGTKGYRLLRPFNGIEACGLSASVSAYFPSGSVALFSPRIDSDDDALRAKLLCSLADQFWMQHSSSID